MAVAIRRSVALGAHRREASEEIPMRLYEVRRLIKLVEESEIGELEVWKWWGRIRIRKDIPQNGGGVQVATSGLVPQVQPTPQAPAPAIPAAPAPVSEPAVVDEEEGLVAIKSPMVGTFYRAPAPDAEPYVQLVDAVEPGQTVCIIEAMKLMNEIQSEVGGKIARILAENAQPVEFGQELFLVREN
jgi:acetyl-CoA carboxylase biotin carboxyl carrier protein